MFPHHNYSLKKGESVGRVISVRGFKYILIIETGELETELSGKLLYGAESENLPKVGDWVTFLDYGETGYIIDILPRVNALSRKNPGGKTERQVMATNIDHALIVQGLDRDFNLMRLDRYLTQIISCHIEPIVVINKSDLRRQYELPLHELHKLKRDCAIFFCSTLTGDGIRELKDALVPCQTYIMVGSSGVGKSSLLNVLMETNIQTTGAVSSFNSKGTHTTTTRDLFRLPNGSLMIDTPGMRELGMTNNEGEFNRSLFPAIDEFAQACRYADCKHMGDAGCGVTAAVRSGKLDEKIYESYLKLMKEQNRFEIRIEDKKRIDKQFGRMTKEAKNHRRKNKY